MFSFLQMLQMLLQDGQRPGHCGSGDKTPINCGKDLFFWNPTVSVDNIPFKFIWRPFFWSVAILVDKKTIQI